MNCFSLSPNPKGEYVSRLVSGACQRDDLQSKTAMLVNDAMNPPPELCWAELQDVLNPSSGTVRQRRAIRDGSSRTSISGSAFRARASNGLALNWVRVPGREP